jgi:phosphoglucomutase
VTDWIQTQANALLTHNLRGVKRLPFERAQRASTTHPYDYMDAYIGDLTSVVELEVIRSANLTLGVDSLGGAGVLYWGPISDRYKLPLTVVNEAVDPTFRFMTLD